MNNYLLWLNKRFNKIKDESRNEENSSAPKNIDSKSFNTPFFERGGISSIVNTINKETKESGFKGRFII